MFVYALVNEVAFFIDLMPGHPYELVS